MLGVEEIASRGEMPKKAASKRSMPWRNPPRRGKSRFLRAAGPRDVGTGPTPSAPSRSRSQNARGLPAPGNRQPMPTIAIGSGRSVQAISVPARVPRERFVREESRQRVDRGIIIDQRRG